MKLRRDEILKMFVGYFPGKRIYIADPSLSVRGSVSDVVLGLGAEKDNVHLIATFNQLVDKFTEERPDIVICSYMMGKHSSIDVVEEIRNRFNTTDYPIFLVLAANEREVTAASADEEDVDGYVRKPIVPIEVCNALAEAIHRRLNPTPYLIAIREGKRHLELGEIGNAESRFVKALELTDQPSLAHYYLGHVRSIKRMITESESSFNDGLNINRLHYKCLAGLYQLFTETNQFQKAYGVLVKISKHFPLTSTQLYSAIRLAVICRKFEDIETYYGYYLDLDERAKDLTKCMCAGLIIAGKYFLSEKKIPQAVKMFQGAAASSGSAPKFLYDIITALLSSKCVAEADMFLMKFRPEDQNQKEFLLCKFKLADADNNAAKVIKLGRELLSRDISDEQVYETMIKRYIEAGIVRPVDDLYYQAISQYPDTRNRLDILLSTHPVLKRNVS